MSNKFSPRPAQKQILTYQEGTMGVSAVPGSGKTWTLSMLAAELINKNLITEDQEVLIVTLVNSAVDNFSKRISSFLLEMGNIPSLGYRVRTLHGLAHDIVRERPDLAGLDSKFQIVDDREADRIRSDAVYNWLRNNPDDLAPYLKPDLDDKKISNLFQKTIPDLMIQTAHQFIRSAKNLQLTPDIIDAYLKKSDHSYPLCIFGLEIFSTYQHNLSYRGVVDFDDLINYAYKVLIQDDALLHRLRSKWPYILEDEAQDSSIMQQRILSLLSTSESGQNWVRVGDPNQAIYETFTTADPKLFLQFIQSADISYSLPNSGRSTKEIIDLANYLVDWTNQRHPIEQAKSALYSNKIEPTSPGDIQQNPESLPDQIHLHSKELSPDEELQLVAFSIKAWLPKNPDKTVVVLAPRNERGKKIAGFLRNNQRLEPVELLNSSLITRKTSGSLVLILNYLIDPISSKNLSAIYQVWNRDLQSDHNSWQEVEKISTIIASLSNPEQFISPGPSDDWINSLTNIEEIQKTSLTAFRETVIKWQEAAFLPIDQLILTLAGDLFHKPEELSLAHRLASYQRQLSSLHPDWDLPVLVDELKALARNERRFFSTSGESQFNPEEYKGEVVITTAHKSKGLEWDRVYLISANNYNFPSNLPDDKFIAEKWFINDNLNIPAEACGQLNSLINSPSQPYIQGESTNESKNEYARERLRLLYVAITRDKAELIITWNNGRSGKSTPAVPFMALDDHLKIVSSR